MVFGIKLIKFLSIFKGVYEYYTLIHFQKYLHPIYLFFLSPISLLFSRFFNLFDKDLLSYNNKLFISSKVLLFDLCFSNSEKSIEFIFDFFLLNLNLQYFLDLHF